MLSLSVKKGKALYIMLDEGEVKITVEGFDELSTRLLIDKPNNVVIKAPDGKAPHLDVRPRHQKARQNGWRSDSVAHREVETFAAIKNKSDPSSPTIRFKKSRKIPD